jgi:hypothetical protein
VPPEGEAAGLIRELGVGIAVPPDDVDALRGALDELVRRWRGGLLAGPMPLPAEARSRLSRRGRAQELLGVLQDVTELSFAHVNVGDGGS